MKSLKKTLVLLVVFSMILSTLVPAFAASDVIGLDCEDQVTRMEALGIINGFEDGSFRPDETITRAQMAVIICKMVGINEAAANANANVSSKFSDVAAGEWYTGWVNLASNNGIISGYPDGTFRPNQTLTLNEVLTLCVKALGRGGYVDKMGTWPANYVTEAARLNLLKDVKGASDANRGTVAIIGWNTLKAPTWYVNSESLDGEVNLSDSNGNGKTLLAINFSEYTHSTSTAEGNLKEVKATVADTPARNTEIGERQIILSGVTEAFDFKAKTDYKKAVREERTYTAEGNLVAYVPEEVCEDIDSLRNKNVTVVFGEDNIVALIIIDDTTMEKDFLTKYSVADNEITVGGEKYELADAVTVVVNDTPMDKYELADADGMFVDAAAFAAIDATKYIINGNGEYVKADAWANGTTVYYVVADQLADALTVILGSVPTKSFDKAIEAEVTLNDDEDVEKIVLFVSGNYGAFNTVETVATRIKSEKIETVAGNITWDDDDDDYEYPRVYVDGVKADIRDIEAGDVLTIFGAVGAAKNISVIYASRETVEGEVSRVKNDLEIYVDGEVYYASNVIGKNALNLDGELKDLVSGDTVSSFDSIHGETAILYLNVLGEYVLVDADTVESNWTFAVVDHIYDAVEDEEEDGLYSQKLRLFMMDGTTTRNFKLIFDKDDYKGTSAEVDTKVGADSVICTGTTPNRVPAPDSAKNGAALTEKINETTKNLIAFKANADGEIELKDVFAVETVNPNSANTVIDGYKFISMAQNYDEINFDTKRIDYDIHVKCTETGCAHTNCLKVVESSATTGQINLDDVIDAEVAVNDYVKKTLSTVRFKVTSNTLLADVVGKESISWKNLISEATHSASVDTLLVYEDDATELAYVIALATPAGVTDAQYALVLDATYTTSRTDKAVKLVGVDGEEYIYEYADSEESKLVEGMLISYTLENGKINSVTQAADLYEIEDTTDVKTVLSKLGNAKGAYAVKTFDGDYLTYTDDDTDFAVLANRFVDINTDDVVVVSYADDAFTTVNFDAETLEGEYVLFFDTDATAGYELLIIVK